MALNTQQFNQLRASLANKQKDMSDQGIDVEKQKGYFQRLGSGLIETATGITEQGKKTFTTPKSIPEAIQKGVVEVPRTALRVVGGVAKTAISPIIEAPGVKQSLEFIGEKIGQIPGVDYIIQNATQLSQKYPEISKDIQNILDITVLKGMGRAGKPIEKGILKGTEKTLQGAEKVGGGLKELGIKSYGLSVPAEEATKIMMQSYEAAQPTLMQRIKGFFTGKAVKEVGTKPITEAETATRLGFVGTEKQLGIQAKRASDSLWEGVIRPKLQSSKIKVNMKEFLENIEKEIRKTAELGRRNDLLEAFDAFKNDFKNVNKVSLEKLQQYKEGWAKFIPEKSYKGKPIGTAFKDIQNTAAGKARELIYKYGGDDIKQAYIDYGNLKSISEFGIKVQDALRSKGITKQAWEFVLDTAITPVATIGGQTLYRIGQGLEFVGKQGAKTLRDIIK